MSSQSDNEKSKNTDDETHSDKESFSDEHNVQKKDRKKKLKTKELLRSPDKVKYIKASLATSGSCFSGKENIVLDQNSDSNSDEKRLGDNIKHVKSKELPRTPTKSKVAKSNPGPSGSCFFGKDIDILDANLDSNSDEKLVVVGDNIKHLNLKEGSKDVEANNDEPPTEVLSQETCSSQIVECSVSTNNPNAQQLSVNEQDSLIDTSMTPLLTTSTGLEVVCGEVPHNTLNEAEGPLVVTPDMKQLPTSSLAYKRQTFTHKDDTLDDVSEITTDLTDIQSDSNSIPTSGRRHSQSSSDLRAEGLSESLESENKKSENENKDKSILLNKNTRESNMDESKEDQIEKIDTSRWDLDVAQEIQKENVPDDNDECNAREFGNRVEKVVKKRISNGHCNEQTIQGKDFKESHTDLNQQPSVGWEVQEIANEQDEQESSFRPLRPDLCSGSSQLMMDDEDNGSEIVVHGDVEPMEEHISEHRDPPDVDTSENLSVEPLEESNMSDQIQDEQNEFNLIRPDNDQIGNQNNEDLNNELDDSSSQDGMNNDSEQGSNSDFQNFARGQYVGFRVDSTTTDSGIENSLAMFDRNNIPDLPENSESNEASALGSSGASGLHNLQNWMDRGAAVNMSRASSVSPLPEVNEEEIPGPSNLKEQQARPSNSSTRYGKDKVIKVAQLEVIEDIPMECAEHFDETPSEGSILEIIPGIPRECEDLSKDEDNKIPMIVTHSDSSEPSIEPNNIEVGDSNVTESPSKKAKEPTIKKCSYKTDTKENAEVTEYKKSAQKDSSTTIQMSSIKPYTSQRLAKGDSDPASISSQEESKESSLADMDDAIESSDSFSREAEVQQTSESSAHFLQGLATSSPSLAREPGLKSQRSKRRSRKSSENNSPFKKRKDIVSCGQQTSRLESLKKQRPDSDDESSKDDPKLQM